MAVCMSVCTAVTTTGGSPEFETDNIPGTGDERQLDTDEDCYIAAKHAFAMALASSIYHDFEPAYAQACKNSAIKAYEWAVNNPSKNPVNYYGGGMYPGHECAIALAGLELYNITGEDRYMKNAEAIFETVLIIPAHPAAQSHHQPGTNNGALQNLDTLNGVLMKS